jgi:hypothetical protein
MNKKMLNSLTKIARAIALANLDHRKSYHVSIVISGKSIIAIGQNGHKTHTLNQIHGYKADVIHSELDAFSKIRYRDGNFTLVNFRFNKNGQLRNSMPCKYCMPWCLEFFAEIWYSTDFGMKQLS